MVLECVHMIVTVDIVAIVRFGYNKKSRNESDFIVYLRCLEIFLYFSKCRIKYIRSKYINTS